MARCARKIQRQGGLKLIYIDPPFDIGADFSMDIEIGEDTFTKKLNILKKLPIATLGEKEPICLY